MEKETLHIALTGHVDHGKSTLIGRLLLDTKSLPPDKLAELKKISREFGGETELAYLTDQLKEERQRRVTIDTTEIFIRTRQRDCCLIDTPGHLEFIRNMLTGASRADAAVLIVDAKEGIRDQTRRHAYLLKFLGVTRVVVAVNKMDLFRYDREVFQGLKEKITDLLEGMGFTTVQAVPLSAREGDNVVRKSASMKWHRGPTLLEAMLSLPLPGPSPAGPLRLPVQDVLPVEDGDAVLGQIVSGTLNEGQKVLALPGRTPVSVAEIRVFPGRVKQALSGQNVALVLSPSAELRRGDMIIDARDTVSPVASFKGNIFWMSPEPLQKDSEVTLQCGTQSVRARVERIDERFDPATLEMVEQDAGMLNDREAGTVRFRLLTPAVLENHTTLPLLGRYVVEHEESVRGAGTVMEKYA